jgi:choice-of-anchor C domain-containing protein
MEYESARRPGCLRKLFKRRLHMAKTLAAAVLVLMLCAFGAAQAQADVINGTFAGSPGDFTTVYAGQSTIPGWTVTQANVDWIGTYWTAPVGNSIDLDGSPGFGGISQTLATTPNQSYTVTFLLSGNPEGNPITKSVSVAAGNNSETFTYNLPAGAPVYPSTTAQRNSLMTWVPETFTFTAGGPTTTLSFTSLDGSGTQGGLNYTYCGPVIAHVAAAPVPVPPSVLLLAPGLLGLVGMRKRFKL